jgi:hypothetical protein
VVAPWEIAELWEQAPEWIHASQALVGWEKHVKTHKTADSWQQGVYETWRNSHPNYRRSS